MSALATALLDLGAAVSGSDAVESEATRDLQKRGARVTTGHNASNVGDATQVVLTAAVPPDNTELLEAQRLGLPIVKRAALLGMLMDTRRGVAIAGTHGKTTTSAMIAWVLTKAGRDPSYMVGGTIRGLGPGGHWGSGPVLVAEADEYDSSFLQLRPEVAIITNIEADHLDYYGSMDAIFAAFAEFSLNVKKGGLLVLGSDNPYATSLANQLLDSAAPFRVQQYGTAQEALWQPREIQDDAQGTSYVAVRAGKEVARIILKVPGHHNVLNSLAALAVCDELGIDLQEAAHWLGQYQGAGRRFEVKGVAGGVTVVDDYAHHPTEIQATLQAARQRFPGRRIVAVFQPHTYTRTRDFMDDFANSLFSADRVIITEIYASRERDTLGLSGRTLADTIANVRAEFAPTLEEATQMLLDDLLPGDILLTMGAGDIWKVGEDVLAAVREREETREPAPPATFTRHIPQAEGNKAQRPAIQFTPNLALELESATGLKVMRDEPMSKHNSLRIGGPATMFVTATTVDDLVASVLFAREYNLPYLVIGNGTNILVGDYGIDGLVVYNKTQQISHELIDDSTSVWHVDSGVLFSILARKTCEAGWTGQEWSNSVPGSVGGGVISNAGAHGKELKDDLVSVDVLTIGHNVETWPVETLQLAYRTSRFKASGKRDLLLPQEVILRAHIKLYRDTEGQCEARMRQYLEERKATQPQGKSAGSTFKNPPGNSAGYLIEQVGLKGHRYGQAQFSPKHANFMMNLGGAMASEVLYLMRLAHRTVSEQFGVELEPEIEFVGEGVDDWTMDDGR